VFVDTVAKSDANGVMHIKVGDLASALRPLRFSILKAMENFIRLILKKLKKN
jgi:hypothetical protein